MPLLRRGMVNRRSARRERLIGIPNHMGDTANMAQWVKLNREVGGYSRCSTLYLDDVFADALVDEGAAYPYVPSVASAPPAETSNNLAGDVHEPAPLPVSVAPEENVLAPAANGAEEIPTAEDTTRAPRRRR